MHHAAHGVQSSHLDVVRLLNEEAYAQGQMGSKQGGPAKRIFQTTPLPRFPVVVGIRMSWRAANFRCISSFEPTCTLHQNRDGNVKL